MFSFLKDVQHAERTINAMIESVTSSGGSARLSLRGNPDFSIKLDKPVSFDFFAPLSKEGAES